MLCMLLGWGNAWADEVTFTPSDFTATTNADYSTTKDAITVAVTSSTVTNEQMRIFKNQTITLSCAGGTIKSAVFTCTEKGDAKYGPGCFTSTTGNYTFEADGNTGTWTGNAESFTLTATANQVRVTQIVVTYSQGGDFVASPVFSVDEGTYYAAQQVELTCATEGAEIYYNVNSEEDPTASSTKYTEAITVSETSTIKAIAIKDGTKSAVKTVTYTIVEGMEGAGTAESPFTVADALAIINSLADGASTAEEVYTKGMVGGNVTVNNGQASFSIGATADATENLITVYRAKGLENNSIAEDDVKAGDEVVICAKLQRYVKDEVVTPETQYGYIYSINGKTKKEAQQLEGDGTEANPYTVGDLQIMTNAQMPSEAAWVKGYIMGTFKDSKTLDEDKNSNIAIAETADGTTYVPVQLQKGIFREQLNIVDNPSNKGKEVKLLGKITTYFSVIGVKELEKVILDGQEISGVAEVRLDATKHNHYYNVAGQRVSSPTKGLYILNGKKVIVK